MRARFFYSLTVQAVVMTGLVLSLIMVGQAQVRSSTNYEIESESINFAGGLSSSTNYSLESTAGEIATGPSDSSSYSLRAGYQQMREVFISISTPVSVELSPAIGGLTGGTATGSTSVVVLTDSPSGYQLTIKAASAPAMVKGGDSIADYVPAGASPDYTFTTSATEAHFGFSPAGPDVVLRYQDFGGACGVSGASTPEQCWDGLSTTERLIAAGTPNQPLGATTTLYFQVGVGGSVGVPAGDYFATSTLTALPL